MRFALVALLILPGFASAQAERYELGRRMKLFEAAWEAADEAGRKRAAAILPNATSQFLSFRLTSAARTLDDARFALRSATTPADERRLEALQLAVDSRLVRPGKSLKATVRPFYKVDGEFPKDATATVRLADGKAIPVALDHLPATIEVHVPAELENCDTRLTLEIRQGNLRIRHSIHVSVIDSARMLKLLGDSLEERDWVKPGSIEEASRNERIDAVRKLRDSIPETDVPAARSLAVVRNIEHEAEAGKNYFTIKRAGDRAISVPVDDKTRVACRVYVPPGLDPRNRVPVVVALHGMGGSENLWFEGYGAGRIVKECKDRGWILVAPRCELGFLGGPPPVLPILDKLAERYPLDPKRIFLVGHSMGAAQVVDLVQKHPGKFAGVAVLGGGGRMKKPEAFEGLPTFVGVGEGDFAKPAARSLAAALPKATTELRVYPDCEHLLVVRLALPAAFATFDKIAGLPSP